MGEQGIVRSGMGTPRFSIIIPTYNRADVLPVAIRSVLAQTERSFELIILDDGSTDDTEPVVATFDDARIRYQRQENAGVSAARNAGAELARADLLAFLDSDDEYLPCALERFGEAFAPEGCDIVTAGFIRVSADRRQWDTLLPQQNGGLGFQEGPFLPGTFAIRRAVFAEVGGYDPQLTFGENTALVWRVREAVSARGGRIGVVDEPLAIRYAGAERSYDRAKYQSARRILDHHADSLESNVSGTRLPRKRRSTYQAIGGVSAARLGRRRESLVLTAAAFKNDPSLIRLRNLVSVARLAVWRARTAKPLGAAVATVSAGREARAVGAIHGVLVTFGRPESLAAMVAQLPLVGLESLTIVDNDPSTESERAAHSAPHLPVAYLPMPENSGPAGGIAAGMARVLATAGDDDWILTLDDDGLTASVDTIRRVRDLGDWLLAHDAPVGAVGAVGARFDRRTGRLLRPTDAELGGPVTVDYVAGGQLLMIRVAAARAVGVFDPDLFFGFDDLDYCLRLDRRGYGVYACGPVWLEARKEHGRLGQSTKPHPRRENPWRRYYGVRNHIVIMRRYASWPQALAVTVAHLFGRPVRDLAKRRSDWAAIVAAGTRGCFDAWTGRLGRRMEPPPGG